MGCPGPRFLHCKFPLDARRFREFPPGNLRLRGCGWVGGGGGGARPDFSPYWEPPVNLTSLFSPSPPPLLSCGSAQVSHRASYRRFKTCTLHISILVTRGRIHTTAREKETGRWGRGKRSGRGSACAPMYYVCIMCACVYVLYACVRACARCECGPLDIKRKEARPLSSVFHHSTRTKRGERRKKEKERKKREKRKEGHDSVPRMCARGACKVVTRSCVSFFSFSSRDLLIVFLSLSCRLSLPYSYSYCYHHHHHHHPLPLVL